MKRGMAVGLLALTAILGTHVARADHQWLSYHWSAADAEAGIKIVDSVTSKWDKYLRGSSRDWSASLIDVKTVAGSATAAARKKCTPPAGRVRTCNARYGINGWLGLTEIWIDGDHILKGRIRLNESYMSTKTYSSAKTMKHVMCQEIGHVLGLDHQYADPTCMDDKNGLWDSAFIAPNTHDYRQLEAIYTHTVDGTDNDATSATVAAKRLTWVFPA